MPNSVHCSDAVAAQLHATSPETVITPYLGVAHVGPHALLRVENVPDLDLAIKPRTQQQMASALPHT